MAKRTVGICNDISVVGDFVLEPQIENYSDTLISTLTSLFPNHCVMTILNNNAQTDRAGAGMYEYELGELF